MPDSATYLAIESSCDETCAAVVTGRTVRSSCVASQLDGHAQFGGVVPEIASRMHLEAIDWVIDEALKEAGIADPHTELDAIAVTQGPGLVGALLIGLANAKGRALGWELPLIAVDHLRGHVASSLVDQEELEPPFMCLLASGGHSLLLDVDSNLRLTMLGTTRDDAAGEAFDKGARLLGLSQPGGPAIEKCAAKGDSKRFFFTPAMVHHDSLDTSFAGIKTALAVQLRNLEGELDAQTQSDLAAAYQLAIVETLAACVRKGIKKFRPKQLSLVGGVAANQALRQKLDDIAQQYSVALLTVPLPYCADNAAMIGLAAAYETPLDPTDTLNLDAYASSPLFSRHDKLPTQEL